MLSLRLTNVSQNLIVLHPAHLILLYIFRVYCRLPILNVLVFLHSSLLSMPGKEFTLRP